MACILEVNGLAPEMGENCWLAPNATLVGDVKLGKNCTVWFNAVIRGDVNEIRIGDDTNIQDGAVIHCTTSRQEPTLAIRYQLHTMPSCMAAPFTTGCW